MIFSDRDLRVLIEEGRLVIEPFDPTAVQPSSIDLRVGSQFRVFANSRHPYIDVREPMEGLTEMVEASVDEPFILHPGEFVLGSTLERVELPDDVVGRLEGKSSLGRLGLLIHSSLPGSEPVLIRQPDGDTRWRPMGEVVRKRIEGEVVSFDPETFETGFHQITGWYEGPEDRIFEVVLASGRRVRVTAGHNLFTLDRQGRLDKVRTGALHEGTLVAIPGAMPSPNQKAARINLLELAPEADIHRLHLDGEPVGAMFEAGGAGVASLVADGGIGDVGLMEGNILWDRVLEVRDTGLVETIFDLEVRPGGRRIENFLAGRGGVFVSNTAGYVDPGFRGYLTLELSNVANLPITLYPGMRIGQLSIFQMTSPAEHPYGSGELGSKYLGQEGPTPSRYFENFTRDQPPLEE